MVIIKCDHIRAHTIRDEVEILMSEFPKDLQFNKKKNAINFIAGSHSSIETISAANLDPTGPSCSTCSLSTIFPLGSQPWFFDIGRREAASYLKNSKYSYLHYYHNCDLHLRGDQFSSIVSASNGTFLVRPSKHGGVDNLYTLSLQFKNRVYHILIRKRNDGLFALGSQREGEEVVLHFKPVSIN